MSYAIVRIEKYTSAKVGGIQIHDKRLKEGVSHTNKDIDWNKTSLNYNLAQSDTNFHKAIKQHIQSLKLKKAVRKDAIVMAQCLVTSDKSFFDSLSPDQTRQFFLDSYNWLCNRYGKNNVISAIVHMDERTPHMHFNFVPVTRDGRLSAKSIITRQSLIQQQDSFIEEVGSHYGLERGKRESKEKHLDVVDYKIKAKEKELDSLELKKSHLESKIPILEGNILSLQEITKIDPKQGIGGIKNITMQEIQNLKGMAAALIDTEKSLQILKLEYETLCKNSKQHLESEKKIAKLEKENNELKKKIKQFESIIESNPELKKLYAASLEEKEKDKAEWLSKFNFKNQPKRSIK